MNVVYFSYEQIKNEKLIYLKLQKVFFIYKKIAVVTQEIGHCMKGSVTVVKKMNFLGILQDHHVHK